MGDVCIYSEDFNDLGGDGDSAAAQGWVFYVLALILFALIVLVVLIALCRNRKKDAPEPKRISAIQQASIDRHSVFQQAANEIDEYGNEAAEGLAEGQDSQVNIHSNVVPDEGSSMHLVEMQQPGSIRNQKKLLATSSHSSYPSDYGMSESDLLYGEGNQAQATGMNPIRKGNTFIEKSYPALPGQESMFDMTDSPVSSPIAMGRMPAPAKARAG